MLVIAVVILFLLVLVFCFRFVLLCFVFYFVFIFFRFALRPTIVVCLYLMYTIRARRATEEREEQRVRKLIECNQYKHRSRCIQECNKCYGLYVWRGGREARCISYKMNLFDPCALFVLSFVLSV